MRHIRALTKKVTDAINGIIGNGDSVASRDALASCIGTAAAITDHPPRRIEFVEATLHRAVADPEIPRGVDIVGRAA